MARGERRPVTDGPMGNGPWFLVLGSRFVVLSPEYRVACSSPTTSPFACAFAVALDSVAAVAHSCDSDGPDHGSVPAGCACFASHRAAFAPNLWASKRSVPGRGGRLSVSASVSASASDLHSQGATQRDTGQRSPMAGLSAATRERCTSGLGRARRGTLAEASARLRARGRPVCRA